MRVRWLAGDPETRASVERWLEGGPGDVLFDNARRRIVHLAGTRAGELLVKHFRVASGRHPTRERFKARLGRSPAEREHRALLALREASVPVPAPLGLAELADGDRLLVLRFVAGLPFAGIHEMPPARRREALRQLGEAVADLHAAGWAHGDLHQGNVVLGPEGPILLDLQHARRTHGAAARSADLGALDYSLWDRASRAERVRVRAAALGVRPPFGPVERAALHAVAEAAHARAREHGRSRTRRALRPGRAYARVRIAGGRGFRVQSFREEDLRAVWDAHRGAPGDRGPEVLEDDARGRITGVRAGGHAVIVKEVARGPGRAVADLVRGSAARRAWLGGHGLLARGIGAARPLAFLEWRRLGVPVGSAVVLEDLRPAPDGLSAAREDPDATLHALADLLVRLHGRGVRHGDLKATNLIVVRGEVGPEPRLLDLEDVRFPDRLSDEERIEALAQLNASLPDSVPAAPRRRAFAHYATALPFAAGPQTALRTVVARSLARDHRWSGC